VPRRRQWAPAPSLYPTRTRTGLQWWALPLARCTQHY
jgi:hypothetical protein